MADNKIQLPSSGGGLMRYSEEVKSNFVLSPYVVLFLILFVSLGLLFLELVL
ncbi:MAG: preprotein translocase subunit Sec61beta [Candidatus Nanoarchaeia archaeon]|nr:preprotein translocase subunit Sec61beta [Candidatus Nanoarchaeia archaeon]